MTNRKELSEFQRGMIIGGRLLGHSLSEISSKFLIPKSTVSDVITRYNKGQISSKTRSGRPKKTTPQNDRAIGRLATKDQANRRIPLPGLTTEINTTYQLDLSSRTVQRRLKESGIVHRKAKPCPVTTPKIRTVRLPWASQHSHWTLEQWKVLLFSDECRVSLNGPDGRVKIWRKKGEEFHPDCMDQRANYTPGLMVWGCFSWVGLGPLIILNTSITGQTYSELIETHVYPTLLAMFEDTENCIFQHDNAAPHRSRLATDMLDTLGINTLEWPPHSPDLNPIENLWRLLKSRLKSSETRPKTLPQLRALLEQEWRLLSQTPDQWRKLIENIPERIRAVRKSRGFPTKY